MGKRKEFETENAKDAAHIQKAHDAGMQCHIVKIDVLIAEHKKFAPLLAVNVLIKLCPPLHFEMN